MLIEGRLSDIYNKDAEYVENYYKGHDNKKSTHYWIDKIKDDNLKSRLEKLRDAEEIIKKIQSAYPNHTIVPVKSSDEVYISVDPSKRNNSDIALSDCHYDAPFKYVPQCGNVFIRVILALTKNNTTYTTIEDKTSLLDKLDFNGMDYNSDYHCVKGYIPKDTTRILLKLHFLCIHKDSSEGCKNFTEYINDKWTHLSRESMRMSAEPTNPLEFLLGWIIVLLSKIYNNSRIILVIIILFLIIKNL
jgi:hypothetical protein